LIKKKPEKPYKFLINKLKNQSSSFHLDKLIGIIGLPF